MTSLVNSSRFGLFFPLLTVLLAVGSLGVGLDSYHLLDPDEGRNAEVAREMAKSNEYLVPRLNGLPYADKPVLYFAVTALSFEVLGQSTWAARLPSLLFTLGTLTFTWWFTRRRFGPLGGWVSTVALATCPLTLGFARTVIFDSALTLFVTGSLFLIFEACDLLELNDPSARDRAEWLTAGAWALTALGVLTKGPVAIAWIVLVGLPYAWWRRTLRGFATPLALLSFAALLLPWLYVASREIPHFISYALFTETLARLTTDELQRSEPFWYFLVIFPAAALPWVLVPLTQLHRIRQDLKAATFTKELVFLLLWILLPLLFFTLSQSKRPQYILPALPAVAALVGYLWRKPTERPGGLPIVVLSLALFGVALLLTAPLLTRIPSAEPPVAALIDDTAYGLGLVCLGAAVVAYFLGHRTQWAVLALALPVMSIPLVGRALMSEIGRDRSAAPLVEAMAPYLGEGSEVITIRTFPQSLPFYLDRTVTVSTVTAAELTSNYLSRYREIWLDRPPFTLRSFDWWREALLNCTNTRLFVARANDRSVRQVLGVGLDLLIETRKYAVYGPCGPANLA